MPTVVKKTSGEKLLEEKEKLKKSLESLKNVTGAQESTERVIDIRIHI